MTIKQQHVDEVLAALTPLAKDILLHWNAPDEDGTPAIARARNLPTVAVRTALSQLRFEGCLYYGPSFSYEYQARGFRWRISPFGHVVQLHLRGAYNG